eukprot:jgi/Mesvir1/23862/Mv10658-RA.1
MESHNSSHRVSERLADRHPYLEPPFSGEVIPTEIAVAYGRRSIPKLIEVLSLSTEELPSVERVKALQELQGLISNQEQKILAIKHASATTLVRLLSDGAPDVRHQSARALTSLASIRQGREAILESSGVSALTNLLKDEDARVREASAACLEMMTTARDGIAALLAPDTGVVAQLAALVAEDTTLVTETALLSCFTALSNLSNTDTGIEECLRARVVEGILGRLVSDGGVLKPTPYEQACAETLQHLCHHQYGKVQVLDAGALTLLSKMLSSANDKVKVCATGALMGLSIEEDAKVPVIKQAGVTLLALLQHASPLVVQNSKMTIQNCFEHPMARNELVPLMDRETMAVLHPAAGGRP